MVEEFDIIIKNASIIDGSGGAPFKGAVAIRGERIESVGEKVRGDAGVIIDAEGLSVAPGFIDVHNHGDASIFYYPKAESFVRQGITTFVGGNCGSSPGPYGEYLDIGYFLYDIFTDLSLAMYYPDRLVERDKLNERHFEVFGWRIDWHTLGEFCKRVESVGISANYIPLVGHGEIRTLVMGRDYRRRATRSETKKMQEHVRTAMEEGICGISVGRDYEPGYYADLEELVACAKVAAEYGGIYTSHSLRTGLRRERKPGDAPPPKINGILEAIEVGRRCKMSVEISHLSPLYDVYPTGSEIMSEASVKATLKAIDDARSEGLDVNFDVIPHHLTGGIYASPWLAGLLLPWVRLVGSREGLAKALKMKDFRDEVRNIIMSGKWYGLNPNLNPSWAHLPNIVECRVEEFVGKTIAQVGESMKVDGLEALMEVLSLDPDTKAVLKGEDDSTKLTFYKHPEMMIGIDTFCMDDKWECRNPPWYVPNENTYGGFPRYFRRAVKETNTLTLNEAIRKVTSLPARKFKIKERGLLKEGFYADIVVFNPATITDKGDQIEPRKYPEGIEYVIVNGVIVVNKSVHTGAKPGKVLYRD
ncbi:amidohydrolase family protein [Candidatus Bathyarchaeota archaeon]|nr:amidohydrolase family protein [Candidatus Bathyarchaeota archaeon]